MLGIYKSIISCLFITVSLYTFGYIVFGKSNKQDRKKIIRYNCTNNKYSIIYFRSLIFKRDNKNTIIMYIVYVYIETNL